MLNNFIFAETKSSFEQKLNNGEVLDEAIAFIEDTKEIWTHGTYFDGSKVDLSNIEASILNILETKQDTLVSGTNIKTINGTSILGSGDITISGGASEANVQAVDTSETLEDVIADYATRAYVDGLVGDINSVLEDIIGG